MVQVSEKLTEQARPPEAEPNQPVSPKTQERIVLHETQGEPVVEQPVIRQPEIQPTTPVQPAPVKAVDVQVPGVDNVGQPAVATAETPESQGDGGYNKALTTEDAPELAALEIAREQETAGS